MYRNRTRAQKQFALILVICIVSRKANEKTKKHLDKPGIVSAKSFMSKARLKPDAKKLEKENKIEVRLEVSTHNVNRIKLFYRKSIFSFDSKSRTRQTEQ